MHKDVQIYLLDIFLEEEINKINVRSWDNFFSIKLFKQKKIKDIEETIK